MVGQLIILVKGSIKKKILLHPRSHLVNVALHLLFCFHESLKNTLLAVQSFSYVEVDGHVDLVLLDCYLVPHT